MRTLLSLLSSLLFCVSSLQAAEAIVSRDAQIDNVQLHYLTAGHGSATVILLHGFAETSRMWRPIVPLLAEKFTVIAPDLPGIGDSSIPAKTGMLVAAQQIHELARSLKIEKARVVGHDIGLMVAYAYAAQFPNETEKLAVMDAFLPGVEGWEAIYDAPNVWHFRFNGEYPEKLVQGRERTYFEYSGICLRRTRRIRFLKPSAKLIPLPTPELGGCERPGLTSRRGRNWQRSSRRSQSRS